MRSLATLTESLVLRAHDAPVQTVSFGPSRSLMATGDTQRTAKVWHRGEAAKIFNLTCKQDKIRPTERIRGLGFSPDGTVLYAASGDAFNAFNLDSGAVRWSYRPPRSFGFLVVSPIALAVSASGEIAVATDAGRISVWTAAGALKAHWGDNDSPRLMAFTSDDRVVGTDSFSLASWKSSTGRKIGRKRLRERAFGFAATPDGSRVCLRSIHDVEVWDSEGQELLDRYPVPFGSPLVAISPDGERIAFSGVSEIEVRTIGGTAPQRLDVTGASVRALKFLPEGDGLAAGCSDGTVRFWNFG